MRHKVIVITIVAVLIAGLLASAAFGSGQTYVDKRRVIRVGILDLSPVGSLPDMPVAYLFYIMGQRDDLKPYGWTFVNPLAAGSDSFKNAWLYWRVLLQQTTVDNLAKFDVLYLSATHLVTMATAERDKLRRFVDQGGCLWVDDAGGMNFPLSTDTVNYPALAFFLPGVNFSIGQVAVTPAKPQSAVMKLHPLLTDPFWLSPQEIASLGMQYGGLYTIDPGFTLSPPPATALAPVVAVNGALPTVAAVEYGSGRILLTSGGIGLKIESSTLGWPGTKPAILTTQNCNLLMASVSDLRFAYNVVGWATSYTSFRKNYRRTGSSLESVGAPLVRKWTFLQAVTVGGGGSQEPENGPVIWKNVIYYSSGQSLYAFDAKPEEDLDMDGNPDDGEPNLSTDQEFDAVWHYDFNQQISSPTVATMLDPTDMTPRDFVFVTAADGQVWVFDALPVDASGKLAKAAKMRPYMWKSLSASSGAAILPPVVQNGWIYEVSGDGIVSAYCPVLNAANNGDGIWMCPLGGIAESVTVNSGPTFGFVKSQSKGALVQMLCVAALKNTLNNTIATNHSVCALPVFVASDKLEPVNPGALSSAIGTTGAVQFRTSFQQIPVALYPEPEVWAVDVAGNPISVRPAGNDWTTARDMAQGLVTIEPMGGARLGPSTRVYLTYALNYQNILLNSFVPPSQQIPPQISTLPTGGQYQFEIGATPAIGPNDAFYFGANLSSASGSPMGAPSVSSVSSFWFDPTSSHGRLKWNYVLHGGEAMITDPTAGGGMGTQVYISDQPGMPHQWGVWGIHAKTAALTVKDESIVPVNMLEVRTSPAVTTDRLFVTATRTGSDFVGTLSRGYLLCFKADPSFQIRLNRSLTDPGTGRKYSVKVWQPDLMFDPLQAALPPLLAATNLPPDMIDYNSGTITVMDFNRIRLQGANVANVSTGTITPSLPVWVFLDNQPVSPSQMDMTNWDNLVWSHALYHPNPTGGVPLPCSGISCSPVVLGDYVYFHCVDGFLYAVAADASPMDPTYKMLLSGDPLNPSDQKERLSRVPMQDPLDKGAGKHDYPGARVSIAGSGGIVAVPTSQGLYVYDNTLTLIADNHRVLEVGGDGKVSWSCDSVYEAKEAAGVALTSPGAVQYGISPQPLNRPVVAQKFGPSDYLIVDSGSNKVIRIDRGGQVLWSLTSFVDPMNKLRSGEPRTIAAPADAKMWTEVEQRGGNWYYISHCLVVDSGNFRILDIIDRWNSNQNGQPLDAANPDPDDPRGRPLHEVNWVSYTSYKDKRFTFTSAQLVRGGIDAGGNPADDYVWASISNYGLGTAADPLLTQSAGGGQLGGAIVCISYRRNKGDFTWQYLPGEVTQQITTLMKNGTPVVLSGPRYFSRNMTPEGPKLLVCDSSAVYLTNGPNIEWAMNAEDYQNLRRKVIDARTQAQTQVPPVKIPFFPQRAQLMPDGNVLIVNNYAGRTYDPRMAKFTGEVLEIDRSLTTDSDIAWYSPEMTYNSDSSQLVQQMRNAPNLDQPTCAQRLF